jgi:Na+/proline symporter
MIAKFLKILRYAVLFTIGFGIVGAVLGLMHTLQNEWLWLAGFAFMGGFAGIILGLTTERYKMLLQLFLIGSVVGAVSYYTISSSEFEPWLQMTILGALFGMFAGVVIPLLDKGKKSLPPKSKGVTFECDECGGQVGEDDNFCSNCGTEFE